MRRLSKEEEDRRVRAYQTTNTDSELAAALGMNRVTAGLWRATRGLPSKWEGQEGRLTKDQRDERFEAYRDTTSDAALGRAVGISEEAARRWRTTAGLPPKSRIPTRETAVSRSEFYKRRWRAYCNATSIEDAAELAGIGMASMGRWMRRHGLPDFRSLARVRDVVREAAFNGDPIARAADAGVYWGAAESIALDRPGRA